MTEIWKAIPGHEYYECSNIGRVRSIDRTVWNNGGRSPHWCSLKGRVLRQSTHKGYRYVSLGRDHKTQVHILVMATFVGPRPEGVDVCHNDGNPENNRVDNLRYGTHSENMMDCVRHGRNRESTWTYCKRGHLLADPNLRKKDCGRGQCLSCMKATRNRRGAPESVIQEVADDHYRQIMYGAVA